MAWAESGGRESRGSRNAVFTGLSDIAQLSTNPLGRIPSLILDDGTTLIDSGAILDWLDQQVGPERALLAANGPARQQALQRIALASGTIDKVMGIGYERLVRSERYRWPDWIATACMMRYVRLAVHDLLPPGRYPTLDAVSDRCEALPAFKATYPADYVVPSSG